MKLTSLITSALIPAAALESAATPTSIHRYLSNLRPAQTSVTPVPIAPDMTSHSENSLAQAMTEAGYASAESAAQHSENADDTSHPIGIPSASAAKKSHANTTQIPQTNRCSALQADNEALLNMRNTLTERQYSLVADRADVVIDLQDCINKLNDNPGHLRRTSSIAEQNLPVSKDSAITNQVAQPDHESKQNTDEVGDAPTNTIDPIHSPIDNPNNQVTKPANDTADDMQNQLDDAIDQIIDSLDNKCVQELGVHEDLTNQVMYLLGENHQLLAGTETFRTELEQCLEKLKNGSEPDFSFPFGGIRGNNGGRTKTENLLIGLNVVTGAGFVALAAALIVVLGRQNARQQPAVVRAIRVGEVAVQQTPPTPQQTTIPMAFARLADDLTTATNTVVNAMSDAVRRAMHPDTEPTEDAGIELADRPQQAINSENPVRDDIRADAASRTVESDQVPALPNTDRERVIGTSTTSEVPHAES